jgi:hypothetical protein
VALGFRAAFWFWFALVCVAVAFRFNAGFVLLFSCRARLRSPVHVCSLFILRLVVLRFIRGLRVTVLDFVLVWFAWFGSFVSAPRSAPGSA